jgi:hypothetical protein
VLAVGVGGWCWRLVLAPACSPLSSSFPSVIVVPLSQLSLSVLLEAPHLPPRAVSCRLGGGACRGGGHRGVGGWTSSSSKQRT